LEGQRRIGKKKGNRSRNSLQRRREKSKRKHLWGKGALRRNVGQDTDRTHWTTSVEKKEERPIK